MILAKRIYSVLVFKISVTQIRIFRYKIFVRECLFVIGVINILNLAESMKEKKLVKVIIRSHYIATIFTKKEQIYQINIG